MTLKIARQLVVAPQAKPRRFVMVIHGVFGSGANWRLFMRRVVADRPDFGAVLVDLRGHGQSTGAEPPHTIARTAADLADIEAELEGSLEVVVGHSLGGKVALAFAQQHALRQVWTLDSNPGIRPADPSADTFRVLAFLESVPERLASRPEFVSLAREAGFSSAITAWLAMNVRPRSDGGYQLRLDLPTVRSVLEDYYRTDYWSVLESPPAGCAAHVVVAENSFVWQPEDVTRVRAAAENPRVHHHRLPNSGHWVHVDDPEGVHRLLVEHLPKAAP